jgi:uncharacterized cupredoxin-like copper-binding protein
VQLAQALRVAVAVAVVGGSACGLALASTSGRAAATSSRPTVKITERDFSISAPKHVRAGDVMFTVTNAGPDTHELIVVRSNGRPLPLRTDGLTIDETRVERRTVGALDGAGPHTTRTLHVHLAPGRYVLLCNMAGHFLGGMHRQLVVR